MNVESLLNKTAEIEHRKLEQSKGQTRGEGIGRIYDGMLAEADALCDIANGQLDLIAIATARTSLEVPGAPRFDSIGSVMGAS